MTDKFAGTRMHRVCLSIALSAVAAAGAWSIASAGPNSACISDAELETAVGDQVRSGRFAIDTSHLRDAPMCSGLTVAQAIQRLVEGASGARTVSGPAQTDQRNASTAPSIIAPQLPSRQTDSTYAELAQYAGHQPTYPVRGYTFWEHPLVAPQLKKMNLSGPYNLSIHETNAFIKLDGNVLVSGGCFAGECQTEYYRLFMNLDNGSTAVCYVGGQWQEKLWFTSRKPDDRIEFTGACPDRPFGAPSSIRAGLLTQPAAAASGAGQMGRITGQFGYPSNYFPDDITACAEPLGGGREICAKAKVQGNNPAIYTLQVPPGRYHVYARSSDMPGTKAYYTQSVICGGGTGGESRCTNHARVVVTVAAGAVRSGVNPDDWYDN